MEEDQKQKHVCKFCKKIFPCGRSLGGHMRSHMTLNSSETEENLNRKKVDSVDNGSNNSNTNTYTGFEASGHAGYGLRENPKKTWRISDSSDANLQQEKVCKECGKGFQSWKALFGHMRCHSDRERVSNSLEDGSWSLVMDSQSDNETAAPKRRRRSRRMRYKTTTTISSSFSLANASSSVSEIEQEQEEVAICLMMLSRDVGYWGGLNSVAESSDNNSMILEARSSCLNKRITKKECRNFVSKSGGTVKMKKPRDKKLESGVWNSENVNKNSEFSVSESGFLRNGVKKVELEVSVDGFLKDGEFMKPELDDESGFEVSDAELGKQVCNGNRLKRSEAELEKDLIKEDGSNQADSMPRKYNSSKRTRCNRELGGGSCKKITYDAFDSEICKDAQKKSKYECTTCNKIFHSYQALGGHRASHKKIRGCSTSRIENSENSIETEISPAPKADSTVIKSCSNKNPMDQDLVASGETTYGSKKNKRHECPICLKVFASGQALGGHKRSHFVGGSEARGSQTIVIHKQLPETCDLLDLNLPAPNEEETDGQVGFKPWWVGRNHEHEPLVGLISN